MTIEYRTGDLLNQPDLDAIAHGANCVGVSGAGVAGIIAHRFPASTAEYKRKCSRYPLTPGKAYITSSEWPIIVWLTTQFTPGPSAKLGYIYNSLMSLIEEIDQGWSQIETVGIPRLGCGIGGLEWPMVKKVIEEAVGDSTSLHVVVCTP